MISIKRSVPAISNRPRENSISVGAARHQRFLAAGAAAGDQLLTISLQQSDAVERNAEGLMQ
jgi:hypothetical protein